MSETVTVRRREFGFSLMDDCGSTAYVPDDDAPAVALALLGGITDELVERGCDAAVEAIRDSAIDWPTYHEAFEPIVRAVLAAIGGGGEGEE